MAIRIRTVDGVTVALCAVESDAQKGDIYLDDGAHHALSTKFGLDFHSMGFMDSARADPVVVAVMESQKVRDAKEELHKWLAAQKGTRVCGSQGKFAKREGREKDKYCGFDKEDIVEPSQSQMDLIAELVEGVVPLEGEVCEWVKENDSPEAWSRECKVVADGTPIYVMVDMEFMQFEFCPYCGRTIKK